MEKSELQNMNVLIPGTELDNKLRSLLNSPIVLKEFLVSPGLPWTPEGTQYLTSFLQT